MGIVLLATFLMRTEALSTKEKLVWLTPGQLSGGPFTRLKHALMNLTAPLWRGYWNNQPQILIDSSLQTAPSAAVTEAGLGAAVGTNIDGTRAWIVSAAELSALQKRLREIAEVSVVATPRLMAANGTACQFFVGGATTSAGATPAGVTMELIPEVIADSVRLTVGVTSTEAIVSSSNRASTLRTNLSAACRLVLPNSGGLVLASDYPKEPGATNWVWIISPRVWRVMGKSIKPR